MPGYKSPRRTEAEWFHSHLQSRGHQVRSAQVRGAAVRIPGLAVGENEILALVVDFSQRSEQRAEVDLGAPYPARNEIERVDPDAHQRERASAMARLWLAIWFRGLSARARRKSEIAPVKSPMF